MLANVLSVLPAIVINFKFAMYSGVTWNSDKGATLLLSPCRFLPSLVPHLLVVLLPKRPTKIESEESMNSSWKNSSSGQ